MADKAEGSLFFHNEELCETEAFSQIYRVLTPSVYEVIRVMNGIPLFLEEHFKRLEGSLASIGRKNPYTLADLKEKICRLSEENHIENQNLKLVINDFEKPEPERCLFFIPTSYPTEEMYRDGVPTDLLSAVRENPHAKIINQSLRDTADALMKEKHLFEAILVDNEGRITEGSRSNIFLIKDGIVYTCPADGVLLGVTRQRIIRICRENGIEVKEVFVPADGLKEYQAAFISGTSPKVLPIAAIGEQKLDRGDAVLCRIMELYDAEIAAYLKKA